MMHKVRYERSKEAKKHAARWFPINCFYCVSCSLFNSPSAHGRFSLGLWPGCHHFRRVCRSRIYIYIYIWRWAWLKSKDKHVGIIWYTYVYYCTMHRQRTNKRQATIEKSKQTNMNREKERKRENKKKTDTIWRGKSHHACIWCGGRKCTSVKGRLNRIRCTQFSHACINAIAGWITLSTHSLTHSIHIIVDVFFCCCCYSLSFSFYCVSRRCSARRPLLLSSNLGARMAAAALQ